MILSHISSEITQSGATRGSVLAVTFSWARNRSILWAMVAGLLSWFHVIHFALTRRDEERQTFSPGGAMRKRVMAKRLQDERDG